MKSKSNFVLQGIAVLAILVFAASCKESPKEEKQANKPEISALTKFRGALAGLNIQDQKAIFSRLPDAYKFALWKDRFSTKWENATDENQKRILQMLMDSLSVSDYADSTHRVKEAYYSRLMEEALKAYKNDTAAVMNLMFRLGDRNEEKPISKDGGMPPCDCSSKKDWCYPWDKCVVGNCVTSLAGCGPAWLWSCDGTCQ